MEWFQKESHVVTIFLHKAKLTLGKVEGKYKLYKMLLINVNTYKEVS